MDAITAGFLPQTARMMSTRLPTLALRRHEAAFAVAQHEAAKPPPRAISSTPGSAPRALRRGGSRGSARDSDEEHPMADDHENRAAAGNMAPAAAACFNPQGRRTP